MILEPAAPKRKPVPDNGNKASGAVLSLDSAVVPISPELLAKVLNPIPTLDGAKATAFRARPTG